MKNKSTFPWKSLNLALSLAGIVVIPVAVAAVIGRWLDMRWGTWPWIFLILTFAAFVISNIFIVFKSLKIMNEIERSAEGRSASEQEGDKEKNAH